MIEPAHIVAIVVLFLLFCIVAFGLAVVNNLPGEDE